MSIFQRSLTREFTAVGSSVVAVLVAIMVVQAFITQLKRAASGSIEPESVIALLGFLLVAYLPVILALALFVSVLLTLSRSYRDSEMPVWFSSGLSITAGQIVTQSRSNEVRNVSLCSLVAVDQNRLAVIDDGHSGFARHWANFRQAHEKMPAAVVLGGDPAALVASSTELPDGVDAYHLTGLLRGRAVDVVKCRTHGLEVPATGVFFPDSSD